MIDYKQDYKYSVILTTDMKSFKTRAEKMKTVEPLVAYDFSQPFFALQDDCIFLSETVPKR